MRPLARLAVLALTLLATPGAQAPGCPARDDGTRCLVATPFRDTSIEVRVAETPPPEQGLALSIRRHAAWTALPPFPANGIFIHVGLPWHRGAPLPTVAAGDLGGTGREDLVVLGRCQNGPGSEPLACMAIYRATGDGRFAIDASLQRALMDDPPQSCLAAPGCDLLAVARRAIAR